MGTFDQWLQFYVGKILGLQAFYQQFVSLMRAEYLQTIVDLHGAGGTFGSTPVSFSYAGGLLTIDAEWSGVNGNGRRMTYRPDDGGDPVSMGFEDCPYQDTAATDYHVGANFVQLPATAEVGQDGAKHFGTYFDAIGAEYTPDSVADLGGGLGLRFTLTTALTAPTKWSGGGKSRPVWVYKVNPATVSSEAVAVGTLELSGGAFRVDIAHYFGQVAPSTTAGDYRVVVMGPVFSLTAWSSDDVIELGLVNGGVWDATSAPLLWVVGDWILAFGVQHETNGRHKLIGYDAGEQCEAFDAPPFAGGWVQTLGSAIVYEDGVVSFGATDDQVILRRFLDHLETEDNAPASGYVWQIKSMSVRCKNGTDGPDGLVALRLRRRARNGEGAISTVATASTGGTGAWETVTAAAMNHTIDPTYVYWLELEVFVDSPDTLSECKVSDVSIIYRKGGPE